MPLFHYLCPGCGRPSAIDPDGFCQNVLNAGSICGWRMPINYADGNRTYRTKMEKHTTSPASGVSGPYSWVAEAGSYELFQAETARSGSVMLDPSMEYLFLWHTPSGDAPIASLLHADGSTVQAASGVVMPLNSKIQNLHHHYNNHEAQFITVAEGPGLEIVSPDLSLSGEYEVIKEGKVVYAYNPVTRTSRDS